MDTDLLREEDLAPLHGNGATAHHHPIAIADAEGRWGALAEIDDDPLTVFQSNAGEVSRFAVLPADALRAFQAVSDGMLIACLSHALPRAFLVTLLVLPGLCAGAGPVTS